MLSEATNSFRSAGLAGDRAAFINKFTSALEIADRVRSDEDSFAGHWKDLLRFDLERADAEAIIEDVDRAVELDLSADFSLPLIKEFVLRNKASLKKSSEYISKAIEQPTPSIDADLCIGAWFRLLLLHGDFSSSRDIWIKTLDIANDIARERSLVPALLPDYLEPLVQKPPAHFLSFHSAGRRSGVVHFKPADLPRHVIIDEGGYSGWSTLALARLQSLPLPSYDEAQVFHQKYHREIVQGNVSKYKQKSVDMAVRLPSEFVFVALQVATDRTQNLARIPMLDMLDIVVRRFRGTHIKVVVKRHPMCADEEVTKKLERLLDRGDIIISDISIHQLISACCAVCTVNSGVGSEAIAHLKPVYVFGEADYNCSAHAISSSAEFEEKTKDISLPCSEADMKRFLCYYRTRYQRCIDHDDALRALLEEKLFPPVVEKREASRNRLTPIAIACAAYSFSGLPSRLTHWLKWSR